MWVYNTTYKTTTWYSPFHLTYGMEVLLPIELEVMTLHTSQQWNLLWKNPNTINYCNLMSWMNCNLECTNPLRSRKFNKKNFWQKGEKKEFKEGDLVMMFDIWHHCKACKKLLPKWFGPFVIKKVFVNNEFYEFKNVNGSPYPNCINHDKLNFFLDMWFQRHNP